MVEVSAQVARGELEAKETQVYEELDGRGGCQREQGQVRMMERFTAPDSGSAGGIKGSGAGSRAVWRSAARGLAWQDDMDAGPPEPRYTLSHRSPDLPRGPVSLRWGTQAQTDREGSPAHGKGMT